MTVAVLVNLLGLISLLISLLSIYCGWWELGRKTTLSPLETAKAFGALIPREVYDNATVEQILRQVGKRRIRYGEILVSGRAGEEFLAPRKALRSRLRMADEKRARKLEAGVSFVPA
jgi:hypothetical protein